MLARPPELERRCQALAILEAILMPEWEYRYYSFNRNWAPGQRLGSMRDGCGSHWFLLFRDGLAFLKGYENGRPRVSTGDVPAVYAPELAEPAFMMEDVTFCAWWDEGWHGDTSSPELAMLHGEPWTYATWAAEYYEVPVDVDLVAQIYAGQALTERLVRGLNPELALASLAEDLAETGYPC